MLLKQNPNAPKHYELELQISPGANYPGYGVGGTIH